MDKLKTEILDLLKDLIKIPSYSSEEKGTADLLESFIFSKGLKCSRKLNNVWVLNNHFNLEKPIILLNSHHDTIKPAETWTIDPFLPKVENGKLFGLGSNDAGGSLVSLLGVFLILNEKKDNPYNLIFAATAEEEISGKNGIECIIDDLGKIDLAIVGEPTLMQMAVVEKGLLVLDCEATGETGHAARDEGINAIYKVFKDIEWIKNYSFPKESELLGKVKLTVTQISAGSQHNVIPDKCKFVIDVRTNELYSNQEVYEVIKNNLNSEIKPRSFNLNFSCISLDHPIVKKGEKLGLTYFGSPTVSDQSKMPFISIKIGPGDSRRSHTADEFIYIQEIFDGVDMYLKLLDKLIL